MIANLHQTNCVAEIYSNNLSRSTQSANILSYPSTHAASPALGLYLPPPPVKISYSRSELMNP
jgi:hypothetical protein